MPQDMLAKRAPRVERQDQEAATLAVCPGREGESEAMLPSEVVRKQTQRGVGVNSIGEVRGQVVNETVSLYLLGDF